MFTNHQLTKASLALILFAGLYSANANAQGGHVSFVYGGQCFHVTGERELIAALSDLEQAYVTPVAAAQFVRHAAWDATQAHALLCDPRAKFYVRDAIGHMDRFVLYRDVCDLNDAASLIGKALHAEQCAHGHHGHVATVVKSHIGHGHLGHGHAGPGHSGHGQAGHGHGFKPQPFKPLPKPIVHKPSPKPQGGIFIGGKNGGLHIKF